MENSVTRKRMWKNNSYKNVTKIGWSKPGVDFIYMLNIATQIIKI